MQTVRTGVFTPRRGRAMFRAMEIAVVIPAYNESASIAGVVKEIKDAVVIAAA